MSLSNTFKADSEKEVNGTPVEILESPNADGTIPTFVIARMSKSNKAYQAALTKAAAPYQRQLSLKIDCSAALEVAFREVFAAHIVKGWSNVPMSDVTGNPADEGYCSYSKQHAVALLSRLPDLYDRLQGEADNMANFLEGTREEVAKN
jgi:hypothetical protein